MDDGSGREEAAVSPAAGAQGALLLRFGDYELDEARFELRRRGRPVTLQPKVLDLIVYLAKHRERVVTKSELFDTVWAGTVVTEASLSQALSLARRALDDTSREQHTLRTVRGKGLQFVGAGRPLVVAARPQAAGLASALETAQEEEQAEQLEEVPHLFVVLHGDSPGLGSAGWSLAGVDEVEIGRGSSCRAERRTGVTTTLRVTLPGRLLSRTHARLTRTRRGWVLLDADSRNGTRMRGERITKHKLAPGDVFECGATLLRFGLHRPHEVDRERSLIDSVVPELGVLAATLTRVATSDVPIFLLGPSGTGKTRLAERLHERSQREGPLVRVVPGDDLRAAIVAARGGSLLIERVEDLSRADGAALEGADGLRILSTSIATHAALEERLATDVLTRLNGYRCELPPLAERIADIGVLIAACLGELGVDAPIDARAARALVDHAWPGNVRELSQTIAAAYAVAAGDCVRLEHLPPELTG